MIEKLVDSGFTTAQMIRQLGDERKEILDNISALIGITSDEVSQRKAQVQLLCVHKDCVDYLATLKSRRATAAAQNVPMPLGEGELKARIDSLKEAQPGLKLTRDTRPTSRYFGLVEGFVRNQDPRAEKLKEVMSQAEGDGYTNRNMQPQGDMNILTLATEVLGFDPKNGKKYREKIKTMAISWFSASLQFGRVAYLQGLRVESFDLFADYVLGEHAGGAVNKQGARPAWEDILKTEQAVRSQWWDLVEGGKTLNEAILETIGEGDMRQASGLWQSMLINKLALGTGGGKDRKRSYDTMGANGGGADGASSYGRTPWKGGKGTKDGWHGGAGKDNWWHGGKDSWQWGGKDGGKGDSGKGGYYGNGGGKGRGKDGKGRKGGPPAVFAGKLLWCTAHGAKICFDHHTLRGGCRNSSCQMCHDCCPQPGCTVKCTDGNHGAWSH